MGFIDRQRNILEFTLSSLSRRKARNAALLVVYTAVIFVLASAVFFTQAIRTEAAKLLKDSPEILVQRLEAGRHALIPVRYADDIRAIRGVLDVKPRLWGYYFDPAVGANYTLMVPPDNPPALNTIVIGSGISRARKAFKGDVLPLRSCTGKQMDLRIADTLDSDTELVSADLMLIGEPDYRALFCTPPEMATDLAVTVRNPVEVGVVAQKILNALPDTRPIARDEILRTYAAVFDWRGGVMLALLSGAVLAFVILAWDKASGLSAEERREIGILKAIGWETGDILLMKFWEGTAVSLSAFLAGVLLACAHVFWGGAGLFGPVLKGWSVLYPDFRLAPTVDFYQIAVLFFLTVAPYTVATVVPSWRAATVEPDSVMRT